MFKIFLQKTKKWLIRGLIIFFGGSIIWVLAYRWINPPFTYLMFQRFVVQCFSEDYDVRFKHEWKDFDEISKNLKRALLASEDQNFMNHGGFDFEAMQKAYSNNKKGKRIKGGSTISQQVAKNIFLWPGRSYVRKGFEAYFTLLIEICWSKKRIMEMYLNEIEMGNGIYGAEAAAKYYFKTTAAKLTVGQSALIAASVPNPRRYNPAKPGPYISRRKAAIIRNMNYMGTVSWEE